MNEAICDARPPLSAARKDGPSTRQGQRGGSADRLAAEAAAEVTALAAVAAASLAGGAGLEGAERAIRAGLIRLGAGMLEDLLASDPGYRGPRTGCGAGHQADFASRRDKKVDTVLGPVTMPPLLVSLRGLPARFRAARRRARDSRAGHVAGPAEDDRQGCRRGAVRRQPHAWSQS